ncbi:MAG: CAP domain-containing protein [Chloroflexota bacterium]
MQAIMNITSEIADIVFSLRVRTSAAWQRAIILSIFVIVPLLASQQSASAAVSASGGPRSSVGAMALSHGLPYRLFAPAQQPVQGGFRDAFERYGVSLIGYPLSPEMVENGRTVQYFERMKMEYHPELAAKGTSIQLTRLGVDISAGSTFGKVGAFTPTSAKSYFAETGHSLTEPFLSFWRNNGGLQLFGFPISEVISQDGMTVQWFERARMEYHPELPASDSRVQLTLLGRIAYDRTQKSDDRTSAKATSTQPQPQPNPQPPVDMNAMEKALFDAVNGQRAAAGVQTVMPTDQLGRFARSRSTDMATRGYFAHVTPDGKDTLQLLKEQGISYAFSGEIIAKNNFDDAEAVKTALATYLNSPPHRAVMLDGRYDRVGVGYAKAGDGMHYFTVVFIQQK